MKVVEGGGMSKIKGKTRISRGIDWKSNGVNFKKKMISSTGGEGEFFSGKAHYVDLEASSSVALSL